MSGAKNFVPTKALDEEGLAEGGKRFRFLPLHKRLSAASARPAALPLVDYGLNLEGVSPDDTKFSHFSSTLSARSEENITATFVEFVSIVSPLSLSLPLLFRNRSKIVEASYFWLIRSAEQKGEATGAISSCLASFVRDIGPDNFYPFFPRLITTVAHVLDPCRSNTSAVDSDGKATTISSTFNDNSLFWEPDVALIPLFSMLSEISKALLPLLISNHNQTIAQLFPLLSHPHYRVREMTAEASLGYLIRKTRDESSRRALVLAALDFLESNSISRISKNHAIDGLGVSLFESIRLSSGRLHSRATDVLQTSIRKLGESDISSELDSSESTSPCLNKYSTLSIISRCFAGLCRVLTNSDDVQSIGALLLNEAEFSVSGGNWGHVASILFLMRNWIHFGGHSMASLLSLPFRQRVLNFLVVVVEKNPNDVRLVHEAFRTLRSVRLHASESFRENSVSKAVACTLEKMAFASKIPAIMMALRVFLEDRETDQTTPSVSTIRAVARICNKLAALHEMLNTKNERHQNKNLANSVQWVLPVTHSFFLTARSNSSLCQMGSLFHAPSLQNQIISVFTSNEELNSTGDWLNSVDSDLLRLALEYFSVVPIIGNANIIGPLVEGCSTWSYETCAAYLAACARQRESCNAQEEESLANHSRRIIQHRLLSSSSAWRVSAVCRSVLRYLRAFRCGLMVNNTVQSTTSDGNMSLQTLVKVLMENLSSRDVALRFASVALLAVLDPSDPSGVTVLGDDEERRDDVQVHIRNLRNSLMIPSPSLMGVCESFGFMMRFSRSLEGIKTRLLLLQEVVRLIRQAKPREETHFLLLTHFCLGLFQMPVRPFWQPAGELLCSLAYLRASFVMPIVLNQLRSFAVSLLGEDMMNGVEQNNELVLADVREEEEEVFKSAEDDECSGEDECERSDENKILDTDICGTEGEGGLTRTELVSIQKRSAREPAKSANSSFSAIVKGSDRSHLKRKRSTLHSVPSKRHSEKTRDTARLNWNVVEWKDFCSTDHRTKQICSFSAAFDSRLLFKDCTDKLTVIIEVVHAMTKEPKKFLSFHEDILSLYFMMPPNSFSRRQGEALAMNLTLLLEKMGGLNACGSNETLTDRMRQRLLSDLSRDAPSLQSTALRCLCASKSTPIKTHRESLLRLIDDKTFREELALMTDMGVLNVDPSAMTLNEQDMILTDIILRICFSKLIGKKSCTNSQKGAVLSFISSKFPSDIALSRITSFILDPIKMLLQRLEINMNGDDFPDGNMPANHVQHGLLGSIEAVIKYCRHSLPTESWKKLTLSVALFLHRAGSGSIGQNMRSKALRLLSVMVQIRPGDTMFAAMRILSAMQSTVCNSSSGRNVNSTPALLRLLSALFNSVSASVLDCMLEKHQWTLFYCFRVIQSPECDVLSVELSCDVTHRFLSQFPEKLGTLEHSTTKTVSHVLEELAPSFCKLLKRLMSNMENQRGVQKKWCAVFNRALGIIDHLPIFESNTDSLFELANELSLFLQNPSLFHDLLPTSLRTVSRILRSYPSIKTSKSRQDVSLSRLLPLLSAQRFVRNTDSYSALCDLLSVISENEFELVSIILKDMNSMSKTRLEEPDLDRRVNALNVVIASFKSALGGKDNGPKSDTSEVSLIVNNSSDQSHFLSSDAIIALFHGCMAAVYVEDTAVRGTAGYALKLISRWAAFCETLVGQTCCETLYGILLDSVVTAKRLVHRRWPCVALGEYVRNQNSVFIDRHGDNSVLKHLRSLSNETDLDVDVFENLVHLQAHRRNRALKQLEKYVIRMRTCNSENGREICESIGDFSSTFLLPLSMHMALEKNDVEGNKKHSKHFTARDDIQKEVAVSSTGLVGVAASCICWLEYRRCLDNLLRKVSSIHEDDGDTVPYKLLVRVVEVFPAKGELRYPSGTIAIDYAVDILIPKMLRHVSVGATNELLHHDEKASSIFVQVGSRKDKSHTSFRAPVAIALGKLMALLPEERVEPLIPLLITPLSTALRSRMISTRESAKTALTQVCLSLGPNYLLFILRQVFSALNEGFRKDMCIYVVHSLLRGILDSRKREENGGCKSSFVVDDCIEFLTHQILDELKGGVSDTRKDFEDPNASDNRLKQAVARAFKAQECVEVLGELITFRQSAKTLCVPFLEFLSNTLSGKLINRFEEVLRHLQVGLSKNSSLNFEDALKFCYRLATERNDRNKIPNTEDEAMLSAVGSLEKLGGPRWVNFALQLLNSVLNKYGATLRQKSVDEHHLSMLQPFLKISYLALKTGQDDVTLTAFKSLQRLMRLPLADRNPIGTEMIGIIVDVLSQNSGGISEKIDYSATNELFNTCLRSAAVIVKEACTDSFCSVSKDRVDALLAIVCGCLESGTTESRSAAIALLRVMVSMRAIMPSIYDSIEKVNRLAIFAQSSSLRSACISVSIQFLMSFPLGSRRAREHLDFFIRNLNYKHASGRLAALEAIQHVISKYPPQLLEENGEYLFITLTANVARDEDEKCRSLAFNCMQIILERMPPGRKFISLLQIGMSLIGVSCSMTNADENLTVINTKEHVVKRSGIACLSAACKSNRLSTLLLKLVLRAVIAVITDLDDDDEWETWFSLLQCVEFVFESNESKTQGQNRLELDICTRPLWDELKKYLLHRNQWVRLLSARLAGRHMSACGGRDTKPDVWINSAFIVWCHNEIARDWIKACCLQLESNHLSIELGQQCLKNVLCMADVVRKHPKVGDIGQREQVLEQNVQVTEKDVSEYGMAEVEQINAENTGRMLRWLIPRMCGIAFKGGLKEHDFLRRACAFRFLLVTAKWWGIEIVGIFKRLYILPVVKVLESGLTESHVQIESIPKKRSGNFKSAFKETSGEDDETTRDRISVTELKKIADLLQLALLECVGNDVYFQIYHDIRSRRTEHKLEQKRKAAVMVAIDPEKAAMRKKIKARVRKLKKNGRTSSFSAPEKDCASTMTSGEKECGRSEADKAMAIKQEKRLLTEGL